MAEQSWDLDFTGTTTRDADLSAGRPPDGWYRMALDSVYDNPDNGAKELTFRIVHGPLTGVKHKERLNNPRLANTPAGAEFAKKKANCYASRLGVVNAAADGKVVSGINYSAAIGKEVIVRLHTRKGDQGGEFQGIDMELYTAGHPKLQASAYALVGLTAPANAPQGKDEKAPATPAKPAADTAAMAQQMWGAK